MGRRESDIGRAKHSSRSPILQRRSTGFTLIELMIVVAIIGILASIALPNLRSSAFRAKRNEAELNLKGIYQAQKAYYVEHGIYGATFPTIGFEIVGGTLLDGITIESKYYTYTLEILATDGIVNSNYSATATGDIDPTDAMLDILMIESGLVVIE